MSSYLNSLIKSLPVFEKNSNFENKNYFKTNKFTIDENDQLRLRKAKLIKLYKSKKLNRRKIFKEYKELRGNSFRNLNNNLIYMYFTWDLATSIISSFEKNNNYTMTHTWGDKVFFKTLLSLKNIDNKAELAQTKMLLGKLFQSSQKTNYFNVLKTVYRIKLAFLSLGGNRGIRFFDFLIEDFDISILDRKFLRKNLINLFRDLNKYSIELHNENILKNNYFLHDPENLISTRHSGQERLKLDIIKYLKNISEDEIIKFNKKTSPRKKDVIRKFTSLSKLCSFSYESLIKIKNQYENKNISSIKESSEIIFFEKSNYLKNNENPNFERIFRRWSKEDYLFKNELERLIFSKNVKNP